MIAMPFEGCWLVELRELITFLLLRKPYFFQNLRTMICRLFVREERFFLVS